MLNNIEATEKDALHTAAGIMADRIQEDVPVFVFGPGGHSNLGTQELFFRAGGLMHINPILDGGTLLSNGALRSMAIERLPGYGTIVMEKSGFAAGDVLVLVNAYGINSAVIDAARYCKAVGGTLIAVTSVEHTSQIPTDHPARHPSKQNLNDLADVTLDCKIPVGDAVVALDGVEQKVGALSTIGNAFLLNSLVMETLQILVSRGIVPPIWRSGNAPGGDEWNDRFIGRFQDRIRCL